MALRDRCITSSHFGLSSALQFKLLEKLPKIDSHLKLEFRLMQPEME